MRTLKDAKIGERVTVKRLNGEGPIRRRIMDMGITKGVEIYVRKVAPLGDPLELTLRGYELTLRRADAELIELADRDGKEER
ncbi:MAG: ferrous iron transport protein A [Lachnospiraceae bacterium]|nr:ferrous iron transport protein A [Lachnospiraceae bacterium]